MMLDDFTVTHGYHDGQQSFKMVDAMTTDALMEFNKYWFMVLNAGKP